MPETPDVEQSIATGQVLMPYERRGERRRRIRRRRTRSIGPGRGESEAH
jgi:hypothetical protein